MAVRCAKCAFPNPLTRSTCARCRASLDTAHRGRRNSAGDDEASAGPIVLAFLLALGGGAATVALAQRIVGEEAIQNDWILFGGFMLGALVSFVATMGAASLWNAWAHGVSRTASPTPSAEEELMSRNELLIFATILALVGTATFFYFDQWERVGGMRTMDTRIAVLYSMIGKWGLAGLTWFPSAWMFWKAARR